MCLSVRVAVYNIMFFIAKIVAQQGHGKLCKAHTMANWVHKTPLMQLNRR